MRFIIVEIKVQVFIWSSNVPVCFREIADHRLEWKNQPIRKETVVFTIHCYELLVNVWLEFIGIVEFIQNWELGSLSKSQGFSQSGFSLCSPFLMLGFFKRKRTVDHSCKIDM